MAANFLDENSIESIYDEMQAVYLNDKRPWILGYSGGKDSSATLQVTFKMLERLPKEKRELFVDCLYDKQKERFDRNAIKKFLKENKIDISKNKSYSKKLVPNGFCFYMLLGIISIVGLVFLTLLIRTI